MSTFFKLSSKLGSVALIAFVVSSCTTVKQEVVEEPSQTLLPSKKEMDPVLHNNPSQILKTVSIQNHSPEDLVILAEKYYNGIGVKKDIVKGLSFFIQASEKGNGYACRRLGLEYSDFAFDDKTPRDDKKARAWFEKGVSLGDVESMFYLSEFVFEGRGGPKDEKRGTELLIQAARAKSQGAAHRIIKLANKGSITLSAEDKWNFYKLDKQLRDAITMRD